MKTSIVRVDPEDLRILSASGPHKIAGGQRLAELFGKKAVGEIRAALAGSDEPVRTKLGEVQVTLQIIELDSAQVIVVRDTSEAEEELAHANRFLDAIIENIPDMIFVKDAKTLLFQRFNRAGEELLGWSRGELIGKTDHDFYPKAQADFFHQKDRETLERGVLVDVPEEPIDTREHGQRWLHTKKVPVFDDDGEALYLLGISEDITQRKEADERARALERELASVIECVPAAVITWGIDGRIVSWNPGAAALYAESGQEAIGTSIEDRVPESELDAFRDLVARVKNGEAVPPSTAYRHRKGAQIEVEEQLFLIRDAAGKPSRFACVARNTEEMQRLRHATEILTAMTARSPNAGGSAAMEGVLETADMVASDPNATVLILGETGVGKSWLTRRIHKCSPRATKTFLEVNCASLAAELVESELFGHQRGAFTGASDDKRGLVEAADGGTLFLDEIGELPLGAQAHLLTFLDTQRFRRVGGTRELSADVRILAATNLDLEKAIVDGKFRKDLYYRLRVVPIRVPPLRERREDIGQLATDMLGDLASRRGIKEPMTLSGSVLRALERYDWPGNIRELRNVLERILILHRGGPIGVEELPVELRRAPAEPEVSSVETLEEMELSHIRRVLDSAAGNRTRAAEILGISRSTLRRKLGESRKAETSP